MLKYYMYSGIYLAAVKSRLGTWSWSEDGCEDSLLKKKVHSTQDTLDPQLGL